MPTPKYVFTSSNGQLVATLDNSLSDFDNSEILEYRAASIHFYNPIVTGETKKIHLYDYGDYEREFIFENFKTIGGVVPTDISNAYTLLQALIPVSSGGGGGGGDASAANQVTGNNLLTTISTNGLVSANNSSSTPLAISGAFTGTSDDVTQYGYINLYVFSDVASAVNGLSIQQSANNTNWDVQDNYTVPAATGKTYSVPRTGRYFRVVYTNGGTIQTAFRIQTLYTKSGVKPSSVKPQDGRSNENDMEEVLSYNMSYDPLTDTWSRMQTQDLSITGQGAQTAVGQNIVLATSGTGSTDTISYRMIALQVTPTGTVTSGVVSFEGSNDNINFVPVLLYDDASSTANPVTTVSPATGVSRYFSGPLHFRYFRTRISTIIGGGGSLQAFTILRQVSFQPDIYTITQATAANLNATITGVLTAVTPGVAATNLGKSEDAVHTSGDTGIQVLGVRQDAPPNSPATNANGDYGFVALNQWNATNVANFEKGAKTFSCSANITVAATATDIAIIPGNATNTVYITKVIISGIQTTAGSALIQLIKRSTANTGGTSTAMTAIPHNSADTPVSLPLSYTANPTVGTPVGNVRLQYLSLGSATIASGSIVWEFGDKGKWVTLSGVAQGLAINLNGATITGGVINVSAEWIEI